MTAYERNIVTAFKDLCQKNGGASPHEVTQLLGERKQLSDMDTVIDIADLMRELRNRGVL